MQRMPISKASVPEMLKVVGPASAWAWINPPSCSVQPPLATATMIASSIGSS